jgi:type III restriction enzyme
MITQTLTTYIPREICEQDAFFEVTITNHTLQAQAQNLRKTLLLKTGVSPIGLLKFCLTFQNREGLGGIFQAIPRAFESHRATKLPQDIDAINEFRNTYVAHPEAELTDSQMAKTNLTFWIDVIIKLDRMKPES